MKIDFKWESALPTSPSVENIQASILFSLDHFHDPRCLGDKVTTAHLSQDKLGLNVGGVGYSKDDQPLVTFHYSLDGSGACRCAYYGSSDQSQS